MAINLLKNKDTLMQAWKDVIDFEKSGLNCMRLAPRKIPVKIDRALFGYDGQSFDLKLVGKGDGGLREMIEDLNSGKIMYAFCRVIDPKTGLTKFVLINWQGEGAPSDKKGRCANHIRDVNNFFKGAHVTINARTDDDVDPEIVMAQVAKATSSAYSFGDRAGPLHDHKPIGSVYKRTIPAAEINPTERDKFWEKEEAEERRRLSEEQQKSAETQKKLDEERRQRELQDARRREEVIKERSKSISELRASEKVGDVGRSGVVGDEERQKWQRQMEDDAREEADRKRRGDSSRQERSEEVQALISKRTINARAIFEQNTSAGQLSTIKHRPPQLRSIKTESSTNGTDSLGNSSASISSPASIHSPPSTSSPPSRQSTLSPDDRTPPSPAPDVMPHSYRIPNGGGGNAEVSSSSLSSTAPAVASSPIRHLQTNTLLKENLPPRQVDPEDEQQDWEAGPVQDYSVTSSELPCSMAVGRCEPSNDDIQMNEVSSGETTAHRAQLAFVDDHLHIPDGDDNGVDQNYVQQGQGLMARALYDYKAADETEISFNPDDIITNIDQIDEGWWQGVAPDGSDGLFPANYVELL